MEPSTELLSEMRKLSRAISSMSSTFGGDDSGSGGGGGAAGGGGAGNEDRRTDKEFKKAKAKLDGLSGVSERLASQIRTLSDLKKFESRSTQEVTSRYAELQKEYQKALDRKNSGRDGERGLAVFSEKMKKLGAEMEELGLQGVAFSTTVEEVNEGMINLRDTLDRQSMARDAVDGFTDAVGTASLRVMALNAAIALAKEAYEVANAATKTNADITFFQALQAKALGMSQADLIQVQAGARQAFKSTGMTTNEFGNRMIENAYKTRKFTASLEEGAKLYADSLDLFRSAGGGSEEAFESFNNEMNRSAEEFTAMTGKTVEEFSRLNQQLFENAGMQSQLYKMDQARRAGYVQDAINRRNALIQQGLTEEAANNAMNAMNSMQGDTAKNRLKEAAKLEAVAGAMGMGAQGKALADIIRMGSKASPEDLARADALRKELNAESSRRGQGDLGGEMVQDMLNSFTKVLGPDSPGGQMILAQGREQEIANETGNGLLKEIRDKIGMLGDVLTGLPGGIATAVGSAIAAVFTGAAFKKLFTDRMGGGPDTGGGRGGPRRGRGLRGVAGRAAGALSRLAGPLANIASKGAVAAGGIAAGGAALGAAGYTGYQIGSTLNDTWEKMDPESYAKSTDIIGGSVASVIESAKAGFSSLVGDTEAAEESWKKAGEAFDTASTQFSNTLKGVLPDELVDVVGNHVNSIGNAITGTFSLLTGDAEGFQKDMSDISANMAETGKIMNEAIGPALSKISDIGEDIFASASSMADTAKEKLTGWWDNIVGSDDPDGTNPNNTRGAQKAAADAEAARQEEIKLLREQVSALTMIVDTLKRSQTLTEEQSEIITEIGEQQLEVQEEVVKTTRRTRGQLSARYR